jgi:hypothetical protein
MASLFMFMLLHFSISVLDLSCLWFIMYAICCESFPFKDCNALFLSVHLVSKWTVPLARMVLVSLGGNMLLMIFLKFTIITGLVFLCLDLSDNYFLVFFPTFRFYAIGFSLMGFLMRQLANIVVILGFGRVPPKLFLLIIFG